ncbi:glycosyltransferase family 2 protein [Negadavirga shengliensis]|uniref:Glycosyltransferase family 2 protein n=1 Tax=Negadavirga shengliensis TaxID=1389218 RepID=A0ABV9T7Y6_9BACT
MTPKEHTSSVIIDVLIPAYNEENSVGKVIADIPESVRNIIVVNNRSSDGTGEVAGDAGATVLDESQKGYGKACLTGMAYIKKLEKAPDILVFLDADYSDYPEQLLQVVRPILDEDIDMVIGSRARGIREKGAMTLPQRFGNRLATWLMRQLYGMDYSDLGPFRAIKWKKLLELGMADENFGWTIEMQIKAHKMGLRTTEVPVDYRKRIGVSKVSGTLKGVLGAGYKILWTIWKYR